MEERHQQPDEQARQKAHPEHCHAREQRARGTRATLDGANVTSWSGALEWRVGVARWSGALEW
eukprot:5285569-Prymnesium_polylepis.1